MRPRGDFEFWRKHIRRAIFTGRWADKKRDLPALLRSEWGATRFHIYQYYSALVEAGRFDDLLAFVGPRRGPRGEKVGHLLRLINRPKPLWDASTISRMSKELELALRYDIDPNLVLGFLAEVGNQQQIIRCYEENIRPEAVDRYTLTMRPGKASPTV